MRRGMVTLRRDSLTGTVDDTVEVKEIRQHGGMSCVVVTGAGTIPLWIRTSTIRWKKSGTKGTTI